jgi:RNA polymerase sigma factor (sigma-70 family)
MAQEPGTPLLTEIRRLVAAERPSSQADHVLLQRFLADGDEAAFAAIVQRHGRMVLGVCRGVLHHQQDAEDVFQATFLVLARKAGAIRKHTSLASWLHGVAYRLSLKAALRWQRRRARDFPTEELAAAGADDVTWRELRGVLHEELHRLPEKHRAPLLLCFFEGKTRDEAATQLGLSLAAFKKRLERARRLLQGRLTRRGVAPVGGSLAMLLLDNAAQAAVARALTANTAAAAAALAVGRVPATAPARAAALAEGALRTMQMTRWTVGTFLVLVLFGVGLGLGTAGRQVLQAGTPDQPEGQPRIVAQPLPPRGAQPQKPDKERIVGTWKITRGRVEGKDLPEDITFLMRLEFTKDGRVAMKMLEEGKDGPYQLQGPGQIDITLGTDERANPGIYKFEGDDKLTLCVPNNPVNAKRPTEFSGEAGTRQVLLVLARTKPGEKLSPEELAKYKEAVEKVREAAARAQSQNNLKQIGIAFHIYHDAYKHLPAHAIYSKDGKPLLSWRVAILPFIEEAPLYNQFKLDEPWDSPHNKKLIPLMPKIYEPLGGAKAGEGRTFLQVVTGPDTIFEGEKPMKLAQITDGTSNTLLVIEAKEAVEWTRPADLVLPKEKDKAPAVGGTFKGGINALFCDGSVRFLRPDLPAELLRAIITPRGSETVDDEKLSKE